MPPASALEGSFLVRAAVFCTLGFGIEGIDRTLLPVGVGHAMNRRVDLEPGGGRRAGGVRIKGLWVGIGLGLLAVLAGEVAARLGVPSPNRTNVLYVVIGFAALYRGSRAGLFVAVVAWLYQVLTINLPGLPFAY